VGALRWNRVGSSIAILGVCGALAGCGGSTTHRVASTDTTCGHKPLTGVTNLTVWFHASAIIGSERATIIKQVAAFNRSQPHVRVRLITLPEGDYDNQVSDAAAAGDLPDVLDFDGPYMYNYAWAGKIKPIDSCLTAEQRKDLIPSIISQGTYDHRMWAVGTFDSGLGLYVRKSILRKAGITDLPTSPAAAWSVAQFTHILARLRSIGYRRPLDLQLIHATEPGEWYTYGFSPAVWSAGGDLIDRKTYRTVLGYMNGTPAIKAMTAIQDWSRAGYVNPNPSGLAFEQGQTPVSWVGHWLFDAYTKAFPGDVQIVPLPNFGTGTSTGQGSWQWGITSNCKNDDAAWAFISYLLQPKQVLQMTEANGSIPATYSAIRLSPRFREGGPEHLYVTQLEQGVARPRPQTPVYPAISQAFSDAFQKIVVSLRPVKQTLDEAAEKVQQNLVAHDYYASTGA
jgi:multiple sugar transport system substrate-binding protein